LKFRLPHLRATYRVRCPDGTVRHVHRDLDAAFPLALKGATIRAGAGAEVLGTATTELSAEYRARLEGILFGLSERNESLMMSFRGVYVAYQADPCANGARLMRQVEKIVSEVQDLARLQASARALAQFTDGPTADQARAAEMFHELIKELGQRAPASTAQTEIEAAHEDVRAWADGNEDMDEKDK
jgi:hypothetical protein